MSLPWIPGGSVTFTADNVAQQLTTSTTPITAVRFLQCWENANRVWWGSSSLNPATPTGILGYLDPPLATQSAVDMPGDPVQAEEMDMGFQGYGTNPSTLYVCGKQGEQIIWEYAN